MQGQAHPTGVKVSIPLAADQGRPLAFAASWTFLAVMSTARANDGEKLRVVAELRTDCSRRYDLVRPPGKYRDRGRRSPGQVRLWMFYCEAR